MEERTKIHVGLDVHKDSISVAAAEPGRAPARLIGKLTHDLSKLVKVLAKIGKGEPLHIVYEAGPTGIGAAARVDGEGPHPRAHCPIADSTTAGWPATAGLGS